jgi:hypothetical protein
MKVLVATKESQGTRSNDFHCANENEIVVFGFECDGETVDGRCGCRRSMTGIFSSKASTTFKIVESDWTLEDYKNAITQRLVKNSLNADEAKEIAEEMSSELAEVANQFSLNQIIERRGHKFEIRDI